MTEDYYTAKQDKGKVRYDLVFWPAIKEAAWILTEALTRYGEESWKTVPDAKSRYFSAACRHILAWREGESIDPDSGRHHLAHVICNAMFLFYFDKEEKNSENK